VIWQRQWNDSSTFREALRSEILQRSVQGPSHPSHNQGGWRSREDALDWPLPEIALLREHIETAVADVQTATGMRLRQPFKFRAWAIVNRDGSYHGRHVHGMSIWSGIFYLDGDATSARTIFETTPEVRITPVPGLMVIFPSMTWHSVEPHHGHEPRVTIAFDAQ
jgi:hypothetical protein